MWEIYLWVVALNGYMSIFGITAVAWGLKQGLNDTLSYRRLYYPPILPDMLAVKGLTNQHSCRLRTSRVPICRPRFSVTLWMCDSRPQPRNARRCGPKLRAIVLCRHVGQVRRERERMLWGNPSLCTNQHSRVRAHGQSCSEQTPPGALSVTATSRACLYESVRGAESTCTMFSVCHMCFIAFVFDSSCSWTWPGGRWLNCKPRL